MGSFANWNAAASMKQWRERQEAALDAQRPLTEEEKNRWVTDDMKRLA